MKKIKRIIMGVVNWFRVKYVNKKLKVELNDLEERFVELQEENEVLEQMVNTDLNMKKIKRLEDRNNELIAQKRMLLNENKELVNQIKEYKNLYQIED